MNYTSIKRKTERKRMGFGRMFPTTKEMEVEMRPLKC